MYRLCKWIYELGYNAGFKDGKDEAIEQIAQDKAVKHMKKMLEKS